MGTLYYLAKDNSRPNIKDEVTIEKVSMDVFRTTFKEETARPIAPVAKENFGEYYQKAFDAGYILCKEYLPKG